MNMPGVVVLILVCVLGGVSGLGRDIHLSKNVSLTLDRLLASKRYDKRLRPSFGGPPVRVAVRFKIISIGGVNEDDQSFSLDCYFRQHWYDMRLRFDKLPGLEEFSMSWLFLDKMWKPDTYFVNGKKSHLHKITSPNKFIRLRFDGYVTYSMRLTIKASCPMYLRKFPLDSQRCPLMLGSYGYTKDDIRYEWTPTDKVEVPADLEIAQFELMNVTSDDEQLHVRGTLAYSTLQVSFHLQRHTGYFMLQVYIPCGLIVLCSWVSFWIDPDDVVARVALSVTTVLSLTTMGFGGRSNLPKVSYWTALDWFVIICFTSVFSVMIEYACINFTDKVTKDLKKMIEEKRKEQKEREEIDKTKEDEETLELPKPTIRHRSVSLIYPSTSSVEEPCMRSRSDTNPEPQEQHKLKADGFPALAALPRKLSATVREWIDVPKLKDKLARSMQNLSKLERGFRDKDMRVPKVVVTDEEEEDIALDMEISDGEEWVDEEEVEEEPAPTENCLMARMKALHVRWVQWKLLPQEVDVLALMASSEPPPKFSRIDINARRNFPLAFFSSLAIYLVAYAYYLTDDFPERDTDIDLSRH